MNLTEPNARRTRRNDISSHVSSKGFMDFMHEQARQASTKSYSVVP